jgi:DNA-binding transcriptional regulator LsrR (DeoR family)
VPSPREYADLARAARLYYIDGLSQKEVAQSMMTTRSNVSRMLTSAKQRGVVQIRIVDAAARDVALEAQLMSEFGLSEALVARFEPGTRAAQQAGQIGATWLAERLRDNLTLSISWGSSLQYLVGEVSVGQSLDIEVVAMVGGLSNLPTSRSGHELVRELATRLGAKFRYLNAPVILGRPEGVDAMMGEPSIDEVLEAARHSDIALVGIGAAGLGSSRAMVEQMRLSAEEQRELDAADLAGDIAARFYDFNGQPFLGAANDRILGLTLDQLRRIPTVFGIATGRDKAPGLLGALRGGLLDVLCCDVAAARGVLDLARDPRRRGSG